MAELQLARLHEDGERLVLHAPDGTEHLLEITEALRAAVRRDRPRTEALQAEATTTLRPRELQARLRAGATSQELAEESGLPVDHVQRYEWPVVAERAHVIDQVRGHHLPGDGTQVTLGDVADTRLAARGVDGADARWSARRDGSAPWVIEVRFSAGDRDRSARWTYEPKGRLVTALDDEARWLGQPDDPVSPEILGVPSTSSMMPGRGPRRSPDPGPDPTSLLLDDLADRRGQRPAGRARRTDDPGDGRAASPSTDTEPSRLGAIRAPAPTSQGSGDGPRDPSRVRPDDRSADRPDADVPVVSNGASVVDLGSRRAGARTEERTSHPSGSRRQMPPVDGDSTESRTADVADHDAPAPSGPPAGTSGPQPSTPANGKPAGRRPGRKGRPQVPSWDEIVFGGGRPSS